MFPKSADKTLEDGPRTPGAAEMSSQRIRRRSLLATLVLGAGVAASIAVGLGGPANAGAGDNPPPGLLAKIQIATAATNRTATLSRAQRKPFLNRAAFRISR
jgi:hypothetical protein